MLPSFRSPTLHPAVFFVERAFFAKGRKASLSNLFVRRGGGGATGAHDALWRRQSRRWQARQQWAAQRPRIHRWAAFGVPAS